MITASLATGYAIIFKVVGIGVVGGLAEVLVPNDNAKLLIRIAANVACGYIAFEVLDMFFSELVTFGRAWVL